uniref:Uncharacterized protein n=1 Tax=Mycena chlorophos TaxID=658473 RepID=A0ABQ0KUA2_MYCCL|nr:predicted protein [Mycena chlorophos]
MGTSTSSQPLDISDPDLDGARVPYRPVVAAVRSSAYAVLCFRKRRKDGLYYPLRPVLSPTPLLPPNAAAHSRRTTTRQANMGRRHTAARRRCRGRPRSTSLAFERRAFVSRIRPSGSERECYSHEQGCRLGRDGRRRRRQPRPTLKSSSCVEMLLVATSRRGPNAAAAPDVRLGEAGGSWRLPGAKGRHLGRRALAAGCRRGWRASGDWHNREKEKQRSNVVSRHTGSENRPSRSYSAPAVAVIFVVPPSIPSCPVVAHWHGTPILVDLLRMPFPTLSRHADMRRPYVSVAH